FRGASCIVFSAAGERIFTPGCRGCAVVNVVETSNANDMSVETRLRAQTERCFVVAHSLTTDSVFFPEMIAMVSLISVSSDKNPRAASLQFYCIPDRQDVLTTAYLMS